MTKFERTIFDRSNFSFPRKRKIAQACAGNEYTPFRNLRGIMVDTAFSPFLRVGDNVAFPKTDGTRAVEADHGRVLSIAPRGVFVLHVLDGKTAGAGWYDWHTIVPARQRIPKVGTVAAIVAAA